MRVCLGDDAVRGFAVRILVDDAPGQCGGGAVLTLFEVSTCGAVTQLDEGGLASIACRAQPIGVRRLGYERTVVEIDGLERRGKGVLARAGRRQVGERRELVYIDLNRRLEVNPFGRSAD